MLTLLISIVERVIGRDRYVTGQENPSRTHLTNYQIVISTS